MNYLSDLLFLISLSLLSLVILVSVHILDFAKVTTKQKLLVLKIGLVMLLLAPVLFNLLRLFSWHSLEIALSEQFASQLTPHKVSGTLFGSATTWPLNVFIIYFVGCFLMLSRIVFSYLGARKQLSASLPAIIHEQAVFLNKYIQSPLSFGFPVAKIYFPADAEEKWSSRELQMSLAHEKAHVQKHDSLWKLCSLIVRAILFFAPWSYVLHRRIELEMEIFCDETACNKTDASIQEYGSLLLAMVCMQSENLIFNHMTDSTIKRRLLAMKSKTTKRPFLIAMLSVALLLTGSAAIAVTSGIAEKKKFFKITSSIFVDGKLVSKPVIVTGANQKALLVITNPNDTGTQGLRMELTASDARFRKNDVIYLDYDIEFSNGKEKMHARPQMIVEPNQEGRINLSSDSGHTLGMSVLAERE